MAVGRLERSQVQVLTKFCAAPKVIYKWTQSFHIFPALWASSGTTESKLRTLNPRRQLEKIIFNLRLHSHWGTYYLMESSLSVFWLLDLKRQESRSDFRMGSESIALQRYMLPIVKGLLIHWTNISWVGTLCQALVNKTGRVLDFKRSHHAKLPLTD